ncbi:hypothetical protein NP493_294g02004 [Ridgeia piscesae]|uniref:Uncharacterized protein n=1 Tax=Ridgeia piscesae TaxID=27915 RepID=A0AAD9UBN8_RIDPI|nr:hypothetical protein NP493_294g02004 [Ridgeia piscesae]
MCSSVTRRAFAVVRTLFQFASSAVLAGSAHAYVFFAMRSRVTRKAFANVGIICPFARSSVVARVAPTRTNSWPVAVISAVWSKPHCDVFKIVFGPHILHRAAATTCQFLGDKSETNKHTTVFVIVVTVSSPSLSASLSLSALPCVYALIRINDHNLYAILR